MWHAYNYGSYDVAKLLINKFKADTRVVEPNSKQSLLHLAQLAVTNGNLSMLQLLLESAPQEQKQQLQKELKHQQSVLKLNKLLKSRIATVATSVTPTTPTKSTIPAKPAVPEAPATINDTKDYKNNDEKVNDPITQDMSELSNLLNKNRYQELKNPYVVIIGIEKYKHQYWCNLDGVKKDVHRMITLWNDIYGYKDMTIISSFHTDEKDSKGNMIIKELSDKYKQYFPKNNRSEQ